MCDCQVHDDGFELLCPVCVDIKDMAIAFATEASVAMNVFVDRVQAGEVRSKKTYTQFLDILSRHPYWSNQPEHHSKENPF
jgi:hypothetical protein